MSWALLIIVSLLTRSYLPIDETRYVSVAWDMWLAGNYLVPHLNGSLYSDKPPLLFWIFQLGWGVFGVNDAWPRVVPSLFGAASLFLTAKISRKLWPERPAIAGLAPLIAVSSALWMIFVSATMFDMLVVFFTLFGVLGVIISLQEPGPKGWMILGTAIGLGVLSKGPVILLHTLPPALLAPWWAIEKRPKKWFSWYAGILAAVLMGTLIALAWAIPASIAGGEKYSQLIFWGQSAGRMVQSFAHNRPFWWYLPLLPVILFPWLLWPALWRSLGSLARQPLSSGARLCLAWIVPVFVIFSLISGKQPHYLLPLFPAFAMIASYALDRAGEYREWDPILPGIFVMTVGSALILHSLIPLRPNLNHLLSGINPYYGIILIASGPVIFVLYHMSGKQRPLLMSALGIFMVIILHLSMRGVFAFFDLRGPSSYIAKVQSENIPVSYVGKYHGMFNYLGRLNKPLEVIREDQVNQWASEHPDGRIVADEEHLVPGQGIIPDFECTYGAHTLRIWKSSTIIACRNPMNPSG